MLIKSECTAQVCPFCRLPDESSASGGPPGGSQPFPGPSEGHILSGAIAKCARLCDSGFPLGTNWEHQAHSHCDSSKRFEGLSLEIFLSEWKRDRLSLWYQGSYYETKCLVFTIWKRWHFLKYLLITSVLSITLPMCVKTLESCNYHQTRSSSRFRGLMKGKTNYIL